MWWNEQCVLYKTNRGNFRKENETRDRKYIRTKEKELNRKRTHTFRMRKSIQLVSFGSPLPPQCRGLEPPPMKGACELCVWNTVIISAMIFPFLSTASKTHKKFNILHVFHLSFNIYIFLKHFVNLTMQQSPFTHHALRSKKKNIFREHKHILTVKNYRIERVGGCSIYFQSVCRA